MESPTYYIAIFGDPAPPEKDIVESGRYNLGIRGTDIPGKTGDILLLYCTGNYKDHYMEIPGIGIILNKDDGIIYYRYLKLSSPIPKSIIDTTLTDEDKYKFNNIRFSSHWMFQISNKSVRELLRDSKFIWE